MRKIINLLKPIIFSLIVVFSYFYFANTVSNSAINYSHAIEQKSTSSSAKAKLETQSQNLYIFLSNNIQSVANGTTTKTSFTIDKSTLQSWTVKTKWTKTELGIDTITLESVFPHFADQFSITRTLLPNLSAYIAAVIPAGPAPTTVTSYIFCSFQNG